MVKKIVTNSLPRYMTFNIPVSVFTTEISLVGLWNLPYAEQ